MFDPDYDPFALLEQCCVELERLSKIMANTARINEQMIKAINNSQGHILEQARRIEELETRIMLLEIK